MESGGLVPHSQGFLDNLCSKKIHSIPRIHTNLFKVHITIILPSTPRPSLPYQISATPFKFLFQCTCTS